MTTRATRLAGSAWRTAQRWSSDGLNNNPALRSLLADHTMTWLRHEEARPVRRTLDQAWTKLAYDPYLPCTGQGFLAASGAVSLDADHHR